MSAKIAVIYSSTYGHIRTLAEAIAASAKETGATVDLYQFPEILSVEVLQKMHAAPKADYPVITAQKLTEYDGFLFGIPTRYGRAVASVSAFFDMTGGLWASGGLYGKFAGIFHSTGSQHGGQETTALTTLPFLVHHGITYVPIGFAPKVLTDNSEVVGGSAWGAGTIAGADGSRSVSDKELEVAAYQGSSFAKFVSTFVAGKVVEAGPAAATDDKSEKVGSKVETEEEAKEEAEPYTVENAVVEPVSEPTIEQTTKPESNVEPVAVAAAAAAAGVVGGAAVAKSVEGVNAGEPAEVKLAEPIKEPKIELVEQPQATEPVEESKVPESVENAIFSQPIESKPSEPVKESKSSEYFEEPKASELTEEPTPLVQSKAVETAAPTSPEVSENGAEPKSGPKETISPAAASAIPPKSQTNKPKKKKSFFFRCGANPKHYDD